MLSRFASTGVELSIMRDSIRTTSLLGSIAESLERGCQAYVLSRSRQTRGDSAAPISTSVNAELQGPRQEARFMFSRIGGPSYRERDSTSSVARD